MSTTILTQEEILHLWDTRVGDPTKCMPLVDSDKTAFARAIEQAVLQSPEVQALRRRVEDLEKIVAECRDAMPIPNVGSKAEECWPNAMSDAGGVPDFIKAGVEALRKDAERYGKLVSAWFDDDHSGDFILMNNMPPDAYQSKADIDEDIDAMERQP